MLFAFKKERWVHLFKNCNLYYPHKMLPNPPHETFNLMEFGVRHMTGESEIFASFFILLAFNTAVTMAIMRRNNLIRKD